MDSHPFAAGAGVDPRIAEPPHPLQTHIGFRMTVWEPDRAVFELKLQPFHLNRYGIAHGGIYAILLDTALGYAGCHTGRPDEKQLAMTLSLTTHFVAQPEGDALIAEGRKLGGGARTFFADGVVRDSAGSLVATGSGAFRYRRGMADAGGRGPHTSISR